MIRLVQVMYKAAADRGVIMPVILPESLHDAKFLEGAVEEESILFEASWKK